jgi:superfamily I DNA and/or RNA helicase
MHPDISRFSREVIYRGAALKDALGMKERRQWGYGETLSSAAVWIDCRPTRNEIGVGKSRYNLREVVEMRKILEQFIGWARDHPNNDHPDRLWSVACLTFYNGQVGKIIDELHSLSGQKAKRPYFTLQKDNVSIRIGTVDRFQGQEADLVLLSFVQSKPRDAKSSLGFLNFPNRVNVAITRARYQLVVIGDNSNFNGCRVPLLNSLAKGCGHGDIGLGRA